MTKSAIFLSIFSIMMSVSGCERSSVEENVPGMSVRDRLATYTTVKLQTDLGLLTEKERKMIPLLIDASEIMDSLFWVQAYGDRDSVLSSISDPDVRKFVEINYGPWDRFRGNEPFVKGVGEKPKGANFYPQDMTKQEFESAAEESSDRAKSLRSLYTVVRRGADGALTTIPYHEAFSGQLQVAALKLRQAAALAEDSGLRRYLELRAEALTSDNYRPSDMAWMDMKNNTIDIVVGPIETYEDQLFGYKAAFEAYVLVKDKEWSRRLAQYAAYLPELQRGLPVSGQYKREKPGSDSDLNAYDAVYYAGNSNAGAKTIAINLPNDEQVQLNKGARRLQLKNSMRAKFDKILVPIADLLIAEDQHRHITFDAFFANTMFHEVAHGLGIKNTLSGKGTVREALKDQASSVEEGKADILGLYMITKLGEKGKLGEIDLMDYYTTFLASIFRSIRFGASDAHGQANLVRFNFLKEMNAFSRDDSAGTYRTNVEKMQDAMNAMSEKLLRYQGDGDYEGVKAFMESMGRMDPVLEKDLSRLASAGIPIDVIFEQGISVLQVSR